jgi:hypothetical protein
MTIDRGCGCGDRFPTGNDASASDELQDVCCLEPRLGRRRRVEDALHFGADVGPDDGEAWIHKGLDRIRYHVHHDVGDHPRGRR